jgi:cytochrome c1
VNKQVGYITSAHLILAGAALSYLFISKIPTSPGEQNKNSIGWCGTVSQSKNLNLSTSALKGKNLFLSNCASCHNIFRDATGPKLISVIENEQWVDRKQLYKWIRNPEAFMKTNSYTRELKKMYGSMMTAFPNLTDEEIDAIVEYVTMNNSAASLPVQ